MHSHCGLDEFKLSYNQKLTFLGGSETQKGKKKINTDFLFSDEGAAKFRCYD